MLLSICWVNWEKWSMKDHTKKVNDGLLSPKDETWSVAENHSSNNHQRGQCQQHQIILLSHKKTMYKQFQLFSILNCRFLATIWSIQNYNGWLSTLSENTIWMMNECWNYHGLLRTKMIKWVNGVCSFLPPSVYYTIFWGIFPLPLKRYQIHRV